MRYDGPGESPVRLRNGNVRKTHIHSIDTETSLKLFTTMENPTRNPTGERRLKWHQASLIIFENIKIFHL